MSKGTFVFYKSILESIEVLTTDRSKIDEAMGAVVRYGVRSEEYTGDDPIVKCAMVQAIPLIEADRAKANRGGKGAGLGNQNARKQTIGSFETNHRLKKTNHRLEKTNLCPIIDVDKDVDVDVDTDKENENSSDTNVSSSSRDVKPQKRFTPPSMEQVSAYAKEKGYDIDAEAFVAYYESVGWKVGNKPMKSWKAAIVTWTKRQKTGAKLTPIYRNGPENVHFDGEDRNKWNNVKIN